MRLAVISDLHLGYAYGTERGEDSFRNAYEAFEKALIKKPDLILLLGDVFHDKVPRPEVLSPAIELFSKINKRFKSDVKVVRQIKDGKDSVESKQVLPIITICGTHERRHKDSVNPIQLLAKASLLDYLHAESILLEISKNRQVERIGLHGLSGVPDSYAREVLKAWAPKPFVGDPNFLLLHQTFRELIPAKEQEVLSFSDLPSGFNIYLLGHVHWNVNDTHASGAPILVPGSTVRTQLNKVESKVKKGFYIINIDKKNCEIKFVALDNVREFIYELVELKDGKPSEIYMEIVERCQKILNKYKGKLKPIIRFKLKGKLSMGFLPTDLGFNSIIKRFSEKAIVYIDKTGVESAKLSERAKLLHDLKSKKLSVEQLGLDLLCKNIGDKDIKKVYDIFQLLVDGEMDKVEESLSKA